jgi:hypothetical protein
MKPVQVTAIAWQMKPGEMRHETCQKGPYQRLKIINSFWVLILNQNGI